MRSWAQCTVISNKHNTALHSAHVPKKFVRVCVRKSSAASYHYYAVKLNCNSLRECCCRQGPIKWDLGRRALLLQLVF